MAQRRVRRSYEDYVSSSNPATYEDTVEINATAGEFTGKPPRPDVSAVFVTRKESFGGQYTPRKRETLWDWLRSWSFKEDATWKSED